MRKVILDLCGGTGAWSKPYVDAGYDVRLVTLPDDVRFYEFPGSVHGILAAPPCTVFASSGAWVKRAPQVMLEGLSVVDACLRIIRMTSPQWWCLENPVGILRRWIGPPKMYVHPYYYGDPWSKKTCLWGEFTEPGRDEVEPINSRITSGLSGSTAWGKRQRSVTPAGFAMAFFRANQ